MKNGGKKKEREDIYLPSGEDIEAKHLFECRLSVGDMYWDGVNWMDDHDTTFELGINDQSAHSTTTVRSNVWFGDLLDAEKYVAGINIPSQPGNIVLNGRVKFEIVKAYNDVFSFKSGTKGGLTSAPTVIENFSIRSVKPLRDPSDRQTDDILEGDEKVHKYVRYGQNAVKDEKEVSLKMHTIVDGHPALSNILGSDGEPIISLNINDRIEDVLADRMQAEAIAPRTFLLIGTTTGDISELSNVQLDGDTYSTICTKSTDWRTLQSQPHLIKL